MKKEGRKEGKVTDGGNEEGRQGILRGRRVVVEVLKELVYNISNWRGTVQE